MAKIMLLEKDPIAAWELQGELILGGRHEVVVEDDPRRALKWVVEEACDLVLADWAKIDGGWFCEQIRQQRPTRRLPVILLGPQQELTDPDMVEHLLRKRYGCHDFVARPVDLGKLAELVDLYVMVGRIKCQIGESDGVQ